MITKVNHTANLRKTVNYVYQSQKDATVVGGNSIREEKEQVYAELKASIDRRTDISKPVFHAILSLPKDESVTPEQWGEIADEYMEKMGYGECSWVAVEHHDTEHNHVHIVASRIDWRAKRVRDSYEKRRSEKVARELEVGHGLKRIPNSWEVQRRRPTSPEYHRRKRIGEPVVRVRPDRIVTNTGSRPVASKKIADPALERRPVQAPASAPRGSEVERAPVSPPNVHQVAAKIGPDEVLGPVQDTERSGANSTRSPDRIRGDASGTPRPIAPRGGGEIAPESSRAWIKSALAQARKERSWSTWAGSLRERNVEPVPRVSRADRAKIIGMYFEHGGEMCAGSSVEKGASYKALERRFGAWDADRDAGVFRAAEVAGVGRVAAPGRSGGATLEASVARAKAAGWEVEVAPREASGWVQSAVRARDGRTWIVIANGEPSADPPRSPKAFYVPATSGDSPGPGARVRVREGRIEAIAKTRRHVGRKWETSAGEGEARGGGVPREEVRHRRALERDAVRPVSQSKSLAPMARSGGAPCVDVKDKSGALMSAAALRERMNRQGDRWSFARSGEPVRATIMERDVRVEEGRFALAVARDHGVTMVPYSAGLEAARGRDVLVSRNERGATRVEPAPARAPSPRGGAPRGSARREERDARSGLGGDAGARVPASEPAKPLRRWCQEESQRTGREVAPLRPSRSAVGTLSERDLNLKEGRFSVITRDDGSRALVKYAPELEAHRGERISVVRAVSGHALDVKAGPEREGGLGRGMDR